MTARLVGRHDIAWLVLMSAMIAPWQAGAAEPQRLNVLLIAADDLNHDLGCYGHPLIQSPNIDRLAARGVRFERAYCQYALCNPSRTSLLSGRRPETTNVMDNGTAPRTFLGPNVAFLPEYFGQQGYFTARVGKIAHVPFEDAVRWNVAENAKGFGRNAARQGPLHLEGSDGARVGWLATDNRDEDEPDGHTARRIVELLEQNADKPFFIAAGFHKPHEPLVAPKKYFALYDPARVMLPEEPADDRQDIPPLSLRRNRPDPVTNPDEQRRLMAAYYATISFMDAQFGVVLDALDRLHLSDRTIVVFFGDHGWHLGEHLGLWRKTSLFEEAAHAPLIIAAPGAQANGKASPRTVEFLSIYPTLVELCGLPPAEGLQGTSLVPLLHDATARWKQPAVTVLRWNGVLGKSVRTQRWRYSEWDRGNQGSELYDHRADPREYKNLAHDPQYAPVVERMKKLLAQESKGLAPAAAAAR
jgi:iduronate 2-sulfatase